MRRQHSASIAAIDLGNYIFAHVYFVDRNIDISQVS